MGGARQVDDARVDQGAGDCHGGDLVGLEVTGGGDRQNNGQEVEYCIIDRAQDREGRAVRTDPAQRLEQGDERLDQACSGQWPDDGVEDGGHEFDEPVHDAAARPVISTAHPTGQALELLVEDGHVVADDDLVLAARLDHGDDALELLDGLGRGLGLILEDEAHTGGAVRHRGDVGLASHLFHQARRQCRVVRFRHDDPP